MFSLSDSIILELYNFGYMVKIMSLTFGIDYDDTITADIASFGQIIKLIQNLGHNIVIVTGRSKEGKWETEVFDTIEFLVLNYGINYIPVVFSGNEWKKKSAKNSGYEIDIWIDNSPEYIDKQYTFDFSKEHNLSPETGGKLKKIMVETLQQAWFEKSKDLKIFPKRLQPGVEKDKIWEKINKEADDLINKFTS